VNEIGVFDNTFYPDGPTVNISALLIKLVLQPSHTMDSQGSKLLETPALGHHLFQLVQSKQLSFQHFLGDLARLVPLELPQL
jgi:hypothetical protein